MESGLMNLKAELHKKKSQTKSLPNTSFSEEKSDFYETSKSLLFVKTDTPRPKFTKKPGYNNYSEVYDGAVKYRPDLYEGEEEDNKLQKSRFALEQKALLYEKLKGGVTTLDRDNLKERFLVDFEGNVPDKDYIAGRKSFLTKKWDKIEDETMQKEEMHYQDVLFDEARSHGVGFMHFSRDERERRSQQDLLKNLRSETITTADFRLQDKKRKEQLMKERLRKVRDKKRLKLGLPMKESEDDLLKTPPHSDEEKEPIVEEMKSAKTETSADSDIAAAIEKKVRSIREWDLGKLNAPEVMSQGEWNETRRKIREDEFAPPTIYNKQVSSEDGFRNKRWSNNQTNSFGRHFNTNPRYEKDARAVLRDKKDIYKNIYNVPYKPEDDKEEIKKNFAQSSPNSDYRGQNTKVNKISQPPSNFEYHGLNAKTSNFKQPSPNSVYQGQNTKLCNFSQSPPNSEYQGQNTKLGNFSQSPPNSEYQGQNTKLGNFSQSTPNSEYQGQNAKLGNFSQSTPNSEYQGQNTKLDNFLQSTPNSEYQGQNTKLGNFSQSSLNSEYCEQNGNFQPSPNSEYRRQNTKWNNFSQPSPNTENRGQNTKAGNFSQPFQNSEYHKQDTDSSNFMQPSPNSEYRKQDTNSSNIMQTSPNSEYRGQNSKFTKFTKSFTNYEYHEQNIKSDNCSQSSNSEYHGQDATSSNFAKPSPNSEYCGQNKKFNNFSQPSANSECYGQHNKPSFIQRNNIPFNKPQCVSNPGSPMLHDSNRNISSNPPTTIDFQSPIARPDLKINKKMCNRLSFAPPKPDASINTSLYQNDISSQKSKISNYISNGLAFRIGHPDNPPPNTYQHRGQGTGPQNKVRPKNMFNSPANSSGMNSNALFAPPTSFQYYGPNTSTRPMSIEEAVSDGLKKLRKEFDLKNV